MKAAHVEVGGALEVEIAGDDRLAGEGQPSAQRGVLGQTTDGSRQGGGVLGRHEESGLTVLDQLLHGAEARRDDGAARRERLDDHVRYAPVPLALGHEDEDPRVSVVREHLGLGEGTRHRHHAVEPGPGHARAQTGLERAPAHDRAAKVETLVPEAGEGIDEVLEALVRVQRSDREHRQRAGRGPGGRESRHANAMVHDSYPRRRPVRGEGAEMRPVGRGTGGDELGPPDLLREVRRVEEDVMGVAGEAERHVGQLGGHEGGRRGV